MLSVLHRVASAVGAGLEGWTDWGPADGHPGQYRHDVVADDIAVEALVGAGFGVLSEESGLHHPDRRLLVVIDPVDGSSNASRGLPWWATSLCALDNDGPLAAVVVNQATGARYEAVRGGGARRDGKAIVPSGVEEIGKSFIAFSGYPQSYGGWAQFRSLGAAALDLCGVADGTLDGFVDCAVSSLRPWDYLGAILVCSEAGAEVTEAAGRELVVREIDAHRAPVAGATKELVADLLEMRGRWKLPPAA